MNEPLKQGLYSGLKCQSLGRLLHLKTLIHIFKLPHKDITHIDTTVLNNFWIVECQLLPGYLAGWRLTYGIHEVVSHLTKLGVGQEIICSGEGGCQIIGSEPTGKVTGLSNRIGWTEVFPE